MDVTQGDVMYELDGQKFMWNSAKYNINKEKHGITFEEAASVFVRDNVKFYDDESHSNEEDRTIAVGFSEKLRVLMVCHCLRESDTVIRLFSARKATKFEERLLQGGKRI
jgi:uncharacterized DUF497 family protein